MIKSFKSGEAQKIFNRGFSGKLPENIQRIVFRKLMMLNRSYVLTDLRIPPNNRLERLKGNRKDQYSIRVNDQWRICFVWKNNDVFDVDIVDYH